MRLETAFWVTPKCLRSIVLMIRNKDHGLNAIGPWSYTNKTMVRLREDYGPFTKIRIRCESFALEGASYPLLTPFLLHARPMGFWHKILRAKDHAWQARRHACQSIRWR